MKSFRDLKVGLDEDLQEKLQWLVPNYSQYRITRKSVDARRSSDPHWVYSIDVFEPNEVPLDETFPIEKFPFPSDASKPVIVGSGPAGLFAALRLVERGIPCVLLERGSIGPKRIQAINRFWRYGELDPQNNVCFGEGGAGLYSDGKLITRIKSPHIPYVMHRLVKFGAPEEIRYLANPHVGSDRIRRVIPNIRAYLLANGCEIHFDAPMKELLVDGQNIVGVRVSDGREFRSNHVVLATGHSAEDVLEHLADIGVFMEGKSFALGLRVEHPQSLINRIQYRKHADRSELGAANYRLADHDPRTGVGVYSFCMCPGGFVLSSGTSDDSLVCNGMSNYNRGSAFANSAIVISIDHEKRFGKDTVSSGVFAGLHFRRQLEQAAYQGIQKSGGTKELPVQNVVDFMDGSSKHGALKSSSPSGVRPLRLDQILPQDLTNRLRKGLENFDSSMKGFITSEAQLHGIESRTSCPVRVTRDPDTYVSISHQGLYPCGEGAGYAGGITSAACDGIRVAEAISASLASRPLVEERSRT
jgi:uncharacterized FAD-dependent dehydrogenase